MGFPIPKLPFGGTVSVKVASIFRLDKNGNAIAPVLDVQSFNDKRFNFDVVDSESFQQEFIVTENTLQDFSNIQSNIHALPERLTINGLVVNSVDLSMVGSIGLSAFPGFSDEVKRLDVLRAKNLQAIARRREPVMVVTPRVNLARALIESVSADWEPEDGESMNISISLKEVRVVNPSGDAETIPDVEASFTGNNSVVSVGPQNGQTVNNTVTPSGTPGVAPGVG